MTEQAQGREAPESSAPQSVAPVAIEINPKAPWASKTLWASVLVALAPMIPGVGGMIVGNPEVAAMIVGALFTILRLTTKAPIGK